MPDRDERLLVNVLDALADEWVGADRNDDSLRRSRISMLICEASDLGEDEDRPTLWRRWQEAKARVSERRAEGCASVRVQEES
jgi:hypothetical protein